MDEIEYLVEEDLIPSTVKVCLPSHHSRSYVNYRLPHEGRILTLQLQFTDHKFSYFGIRFDNNE